MSAETPSSATGQRRMIGVCLRFCDDNGNAEDVWVTLDKVHALAWSNGEVSSRKANPPYDHSKHIPGTPTPPDCSQNPRQQQVAFSTVGAMAASTEVAETGVCWWDGTRWICGE